MFTIVWLQNTPAQVSHHPSGGPPKGTPTPSEPQQSPGPYLAWSFSVQTKTTINNDSPPSGTPGCLSLSERGDEVSADLCVAKISVF
jgi:hypothetical protein